MNWKAIKAWYFKTFLPYEDPDHPMYSDGTVEFSKTKYDNEVLQEISDFVDSELDAMDKKNMVGPNYGRQAFSKPKTYKKWGNKWYKSDS